MALLCNMQVVIPLVSVSFVMIPLIPRAFIIVYLPMSTLIGSQASLAPPSWSNFDI